MLRTSDHPRLGRLVSRRERIAAGVAFWIHLVLIVAAIAGCVYSALV